MSKTHLKKLLNCSEIPKVIVYFDSWVVCGRNLVWSNVKSHLSEGRHVHYLCYSISPLKCSQIFNKDHEERLKFYDVYSDPLQWFSNDSQILDAKKSFSDLINLCQYNAENNLVVVIDKINCATKYLSETNLIRNIQELKNADSVLQVILHCSEDDLSSSFVSALINLCPSSIRVKPTTPLTCSVLLKKKSGKVFKSVEEFSLNSKFELEFSREHSCTDTSLNKHGLSDSSDITFGATFNLSLTENQKEVKNKLILPHTRIQSTGGHIHYVPDAEDDWDDEDPDDDLEI